MFINHHTIHTLQPPQDTDYGPHNMMLMNTERDCRAFKRQSSCAKFFSTLFTLSEDDSTSNDNNERETLPETLHLTIKQDYVKQEMARLRRWEDLQSIEWLLKENAALRQQILFYERVWYRLMNILHEIYNGKVLIQQALEANKTEQAAAKQDWLAYWKFSDNKF